MELVPELDHFFSRRVSEAVETCWYLHRICHVEKHASKPNAAAWVRMFLEFTQRHGYVEAEQMALKRLDWIHSKAAVAR